MKGRNMAKRLSMSFFKRMGKKGGKKSGKARMEKLTPEQRSEIARKAAVARWGKRKPKPGA